MSKKINTYVSKITIPQVAGGCVYVYTYKIHFAYIHSATYTYAAGKDWQREVQ